MWSNLSDHALNYKHHALNCKQDELQAADEGGIESSSLCRNTQGYSPSHLKFFKIVWSKLIELTLHS